MSSLRSYVKVKQRQEQAKEEGRLGAVFALMVLGGLFLASHSMLAQVNKVHGSLKRFFNLKSSGLQDIQQSAAQNTKNVSRHVMANDTTHQVMEGVGKAVGMDEEERD